MLIELEKAGLNPDSQKPIKVYYDDQIVGDFVADIIVDDTIILELNQSDVLLELMKFSWLITLSLQVNQ